MPLAIGLIAALALAADAPPIDRFEKDIARFEAADAANPPAKGGLLFVGSSSIRLWNLKASFPEQDALNRGFGGSTLPEVLHYFDRIVKPYEPRTILLYAGDNDMQMGRTAEQVVSDFKAFVERSRAVQGEGKLDVVYIAIKPSRARWKLWPAMSEANRLTAAYAAETEGVRYADIAAPMLAGAAEGEAPAADLFVADGLHLSEKGYALWAKVVGPMLQPEGRGAPSGKP
jgi:lysophospholipase L1-like esterase